jgi:hypothetical protein
MKPERVAATFWAVAVLTDAATAQKPPENPIVDLTAIYSP